MRTPRQTFTFDQPFSLSMLDEVQPAGTYNVDLDEELIEGLSFLAYPRVATTITSVRDVWKDDSAPRIALAIRRPVSTAMTIDAS